MHILSEKFRKELVDIYTGSVTTVFRRPVDIFDRVLVYLTETRDGKVDEVRKLIDALADWTNNPTESELRKILDVEERMSGHGLTHDADEVIAVITYCITHDISCDISVIKKDVFDPKYYKIKFKSITINQRYEIAKEGNNMHFIFYPED